MEHLNKILFYCCTLLFVLTTSSSAVDTLFSNQTLKDGDTIVSAGEIFELGFFSPVNSSLRYVGIWYKKISTGTVVWVANREVPLVDPTDTGNLVIRDEISGNITWQSFDYPGNTLLPGMKLGVDRATNITRNLTSWKSDDNPSAGSYTVWMDINGYPQLYSMKDESNFQARYGFWNGRGFTGMLGLLRRNSIFTFGFEFSDKEIYYTYQLINTSFISRMVLGSEGMLSQFIWVDSRQEWLIIMTGSVDICDLYGLCGPYASCSIYNDAQCVCLEGFEPKLPEEWSVRDWKNGCKRAISTNNENGDNFMKFMNLKLPDTRQSWFNSSMSLHECENLCALNVSCTAYASIDVTSGGRGCLMWSSELIDIRDAPERDNLGQDIYIKMSNSDSIRVMKKKKSHIKVTLSIVFAVVLVSLTLVLYAWRRKKRSYQKDEAVANKDQQQDLDLPLFSLNKIVEATSNFSINNKLGQGGFGAVYK
ncbi:G-type lectin S-receptor-like serine/threonine-protein kinase isoform X1, partial [Tanacetum coccineum]